MPTILNTFDDVRKVCREAASECDQRYSTSTFRYPVTVNGEPYTGTEKGVSPRTVEKLLLYRDQLLFEEISALPEAIIFPLGNVPSSALRALCKRKFIPNPIVHGLYHPGKGQTLLVEAFCERRGADEVGRRLRTNDPMAVLAKKRKFLRDQIAKTWPNPFALE